MRQLTYLDRPLFTPETYKASRRAFSIENVRSAVEALPDEVILCARSPKSRAVHDALQEDKPSYAEPNSYQDYYIQLIAAAKTKTINGLTAKDEESLEALRSVHTRRHGEQIFCPAPNSVTFLDPLNLDPYRLGDIDKIHTAIVPALLVAYGGISVEEVRASSMGDRRTTLAALNVMSNRVKVRLEWSEIKKPPFGGFLNFKWWAMGDLNLRPRHYQ